MFGVCSRETILGQLHFFSFALRRVGIWIRVFMEFEGLAVLGTAELCLSRVLFQCKGAKANFCRLPCQKCTPCLWGAAFQSRERHWSHSCLKLSCAESPNTKPCCPKHSSLKTCILADLSPILPRIFYHSGSLPSPAKLIDCVLSLCPSLIFMSLGKLHPFHLHSCWGLFMHPLLLQLQRLSPDCEGSFSSSGSPACLLTVGAVKNGRSQHFLFSLETLHLRSPWSVSL